MTDYLCDQSAKIEKIRVQSHWQWSLTSTFRVMYMMGSSRKLSNKASCRSRVLWKSSGKSNDSIIQNSVGNHGTEPSSKENYHSVILLVIFCNVKCRHGDLRTCFFPDSIRYGIQYQIQETKNLRNSTIFWYVTIVYFEARWEKSIQLVNDNCWFCSCLQSCDTRSEKLWITIGMIEKKSDLREIRLRVAGCVAIVMLSVDQLK